MATEFTIKTPINSDEGESYSFLNDSSYIDMISNSFGYLLESTANGSDLAAIILLFQ